MRPLKLFVWEGVLTDYTSGVMLALAEDVDEARQLIYPGWTPETSGTRAIDLRAEPKVHDGPVGFYVWGGG